MKSGICASAIALAMALLIASAARAAPAAPSAASEFAALAASMDRAQSSREWQRDRFESVQLIELLNGSPDAMLELVRADAHTGDYQEALAELRLIANMGVAEDAAATQPDFRSLTGRSDFKVILSRMRSNTRVISQSGVRRALRVSDAGLVPEDIAYDPAIHAFLLTSVLEERIVILESGGGVREFARSPDAWPMLALKVDARRHIVWATEVALKQFKRVARKDWGRSAVLEYDLRTARLLRRIEGPRASQLGDMTITPAGDLLLSDSNGGGLYLLKDGGAGLTPVDSSHFISPMTPAFASQEHVLVADYVRGIGALDLTTRRVSWIPMSGKYALEGVDGLYWNRGRLIAIQNGITPERVIVFRLDSSLARIRSEEIIASGVPDLDPTHGVVVGGDFYFIANSGWNQLANDGTVRPGARLSSAVVMRVRM